MARRKPKHPGGRPVTTGSWKTTPVQYRVSAEQRAELEVEAARTGVTPNEVAKRRAFPAP